jgi:hypothetical protein
MPLEHIGQVDNTHVLKRINLKDLDHSQLAGAPLKIGDSMAKLQANGRQLKLKKRLSLAQTEGCASLCQGCATSSG